MKTSESDKLLDEIAAQIRAWDHEDIHELADLLVKFWFEAAEDPWEALQIRGINALELPSEPFPDDGELWNSHIWALDKHGRALVDWDYEYAEIMTLDEIREFMES